MRFQNAVVLKPSILLDMQMGVSRREIVGVREFGAPEDDRDFHR
jgi:hypothetical protein